MKVRLENEAGYKGQLGIFVFSLGASGAVLGRKLISGFGFE